LHSSKSGHGEPACRQAGLVEASLEVVKINVMIYVYAISSLFRNYIYVGMTNNLERRFLEHNKGQNRSIKAYGPFKIIYSQTFPTRIEARIKEKYLKSGIGKEFLKSL
jgi:putative endonuclease